MQDYPNKMKPELLPDTFKKQDIQRFTVQKRSGFLEDLARKKTDLINYVKSSLNSRFFWVTL